MGKGKKGKKTKGFLHISGGRTIQGQISQVIIFFSCFFAEAPLPEKEISRQNPPVSPPTIENRPRPTDSSCGSKTIQKANHVPIKNIHEKNADPTTLRPPKPILPSNRSGALRAGHFLAPKKTKTGFPVQQKFSFHRNFPASQEFNLQIRASHASGRAMKKSIWGANRKSERKNGKPFQGSSDCRRQNKLSTIQGCLPSRKARRTKNYSRPAIFQRRDRQAIRLSLNR
ncbi:MAG: hypothetical protein ACLFTV_00730 [Desulfococcaceae bacterium]